ncbi:hypothetical protein, partial [Acidaminococcus timonensis]|uniref:hypothetical protein n=1 Tax=Acidaminococcus TaxID=904 RepID=UPI0026E9D8A0
SDLTRTSVNNIQFSKFVLRCLISDSFYIIPVLVENVNNFFGLFSKKLLGIKSPAVSSPLF